MKPVICVSRREAAAALAIGLTTFEERVQPDLEVVRIGTKVLIPVASLEAWVRDNATKTLETAS